MHGALRQRAATLAEKAAEERAPLAAARLSPRLSVQAGHYLSGWKRKSSLKGTSHPNGHGRRPGRAPAHTPFIPHAVDPERFLQICQVDGPRLIRQQGIHTVLHKAKRDSHEEKSCEPQKEKEPKRVQPCRSVCSS